MPSTYAHYRLGKEVKIVLNEKERKVVEEYPELYFIGLHGPDIFFYHKPLIKNEIKRIGHNIHEKAGKDFFAPAAEVIKNHPDSHTYLSYLYGFICHFALDVSCHGYIDEKIVSSGISHTEIEAEFDRMLMVKDGYDPVSHITTSHINPSLENAEVIQSFFDGADSTNIFNALKGMVTYLNLLVAPSKGKRMLINTVLKLTGNYRELHGLVINYIANPECADTTKELFHRYEEAKKLAVSLIQEYDSFLIGEKELNSVYCYNFGSKPVEEKEN